jgi:hypothetical protein
MRYCARCGFPLQGVATLLANDGIFRQPAPEQTPQRKPSRNRWMAESLFLTTVAWAIVLLATFWFDAGGPFENVAKGSALLFAVVGLVGLLKFLYTFLFATDPPVQTSINEPEDVSSARTSLYEPSRAALPAQQSVPASDYPRRAKTKEMVPRSSVTENTTKLLDDQAPTPSD